MESIGYMIEPPVVAGLTEYEQDALNRLFRVWQQKLSRNQLRMKYYRRKNALKDLGISIPPKLKSLETVIGWPAKAVDMLAARSIFDGFVYEDEIEEDVSDVLRMNRFKLMYKQATKSELIHSCAFATVSKGANSEPPVIVSFYSAENGAVIWNSRLKREECGFTIVDVDKDTKSPIWINLYTDDAVIEIKKENAWTAKKLPHPQGRPLIFSLVYCPDLDRPMGRSRISRAVMSLTDSAMRTALRSEVSAEFFTSPQKYLLGVQEGFFDGNDKWDAYIGNIIAITENPETGTIPHFGQLPQGTMQPHVDYLRSLAASFSGETNIPISSLGIIHDNPSSAEAMRTAESYLIMDAEDLNETNGDALRNIGLMIHAIKQGVTVDQLSDAEKSIEPKWRNPSMPSVVSQSDAIIKQVSAIPWLADTEVALEELGYSKEQRVRLLSDKRKIMARAALEQARQAAADQLANDKEGEKRTMYMMQSIIQAYRRGNINHSNAILLFAQIGINEEEANSILSDSEDMEDLTKSVTAAASGEEGNNAESI